jgi:hypothetical protein
VIGGGVVARSPARRDVIRTPCQKFVGRLVFTHILNFRLRIVIIVEHHELFKMAIRFCN